MISKMTLPAERNVRIKYIRSLFNQHGGSDLTDSWPGGRAEALRRLGAIKPLSYSKNRNFLNGDVTLLSPYIRHGCMTIPEAISATKLITHSGAEKLLFEFAWRDFWRKVWYLNGSAILSDMEPAKVALTRAVLSEDVKNADTGLDCMDAFIHALHTEGYLHNHARMWLASYLIHWRGIDWKAGADWMHDLLLDGDRASNHLSWQWVASTFGSKPYFFNQENLSKYTHNKFCEHCKASCPFNKSYDALTQQLFRSSNAPIKIYKTEVLPDRHQSNDSKKEGHHAFVLFHDEMLSPSHPLYQHSAPKIFIFDSTLYQGWALHRMQFIADCLAEMPEVEVWQGDTFEVLSFLGVKRVLTQNTPNLSIKKLTRHLSVDFLEDPEPYSAKISQKLMDKNIKRFSKYWDIVGAEILA
jgi:deoxyribodipyrimidine photo-lyase